jgi:hypothetical protein
MAIANLNWTRPADWLEMPAIGSQEFIGLLAITDDESNHIALLFTGAYTVDWGDGVVENVASGVKAQHSYTYSAISDETISSRGYKQVLVRVTPQAGQNLTAVNLQQQNSIIPKRHAPGWLQLAIKGSNITGLFGSAGVVNIAMCENVDIYSWGSITSLSQLFANFHSLQKFTLPSTEFVTNFGYMFQYCYSLKTIPLINTSAGTNFTGMFTNCVSLKTIPLINTSAGTAFNLMFSGCTSLKTVPLLNTALGRNFASMFQACISLRQVPLFNTGLGTDFTSMFIQCFSLKTVPLFNTVSALALSNMFAQCASLHTVPLFNTVAATGFTSMFNECALQSLPNFNTALGTNFSNMMNANATIAKGAFQGTRYSIDYSGKCLSRNAVVDIFNGLGTAVGTPTITITTNPAFSPLPLNVSPGASWRGLTIQSTSQDVYVSNGTNGVYKQTGGVGAFVAESLASNAFYQGMGTDIYGNIYLATGLGTATDLLKKTGGVGSWATISTTGLSGGSGKVAGDFLGNLYVGTGIGLYKLTALTGSFVQVFAGNITSLSISAFDGSIYVANGNATGTIYKQTAGTGSFNSVQNIPWVGGLCCMPNGDVYASNGTLFKQTAGTGSFVSMGISVGNIGIANKSDGNLYALSTDVTYLDFSKVVTPTDRLIATSKGWTIA